MWEIHGGRWNPDCACLSACSFVLLPVSEPRQPWDLLAPEQKNRKCHLSGYDASHLICLQNEGHGIWLGNLDTM